MLVAFAAKQVGIDDFKEYALLGDDIVISNPSVAEAYMKLLGRYDIPFNPTKTHTSLDTFEFAKRWCKGEELTPFPLPGLMSVLHKWHHTYQFLVEAEVKGYPLPDLRGPRSFESLYKALYPKTERFSQYLVQRTTLLHAIPKEGDSPERLAEKLLSIITTYKLPGE